MSLLKYQTTDYYYHISMPQTSVTPIPRLSSEMIFIQVTSLHDRWIRVTTLFLVYCDDMSGCHFL